MTAISNAMFPSSLQNMETRYFVGSVTAISNSMFPSSLQNMETRYFSSPTVFKTFREIYVQERY